jgi:hypothetical protein
MEGVDSAILYEMLFIKMQGHLCASLQELEERQ